MTRHLRLRELRAGEYAVLDGVFAGLSPDSRYRRYHVGLPRLTADARERLVAVDGSRHIAVGAFAGATPVGIARLVGVGGGRAELAVEVVDAWQRRGVGLRLVRAVAARGRAAGYREVVADVLAENVAVQLLIATVFPDLVFDGDGPEVTITAPLVPSDVPLVRPPHRRSPTRACPRQPSVGRLGRIGAFPTPAGG